MAIRNENHRWQMAIRLPGRNPQHNLVVRRRHTHRPDPPGLGNHTVHHHHRHPLRYAALQADEARAAAIWQQRGNVEPAI